MGGRHFFISATQLRRRGGEGFGRGHEHREPRDGRERAGFLARSRPARGSQRWIAAAVVGTGAEVGAETGSGSDES